MLKVPEFVQGFDAPEMPRVSVGFPAHASVLAASSWGLFSTMLQPSSAAFSYPNLLLSRTPRTNTTSI